jgi:hypothetical protein
MKSRTDLKAYFETGDIPTEGEFEELIDSARHSFEDVDYTFKGVATSATTPIEGTANIMYLASTAGTYTNFNNVIVLPGELAALLWTINPSTLVGAWTKVSIITPGQSTEYVAEYTLTHAMIMTGHSVPVTVIAAPATAGIVVNKVVASIAGSGGVVKPYGTNVEWSLITDTADVDQINNKSELLMSTADRTVILGNTVNLGSAADDQQIIPAKALLFIISGGDPTGGDADNTLKLRIYYNLITA